MSNLTFITSNRFGKLVTITSMKKAVDEMKDTAERRENENPNTTISIGYTSK
jgi:hypothetical protein